MTPIQARMARAATQVSIKELCTILGINRAALNNAEQGRKPLGAMTWARLQAWYEEQGIYFGPDHWVGTGQEVISQERFMVVALYQLLTEHGIHPSSPDLIAAHARARAQEKHDRTP